MQPTTVLFLAANPVGVQLLQLGDECRAIEDKVRQTKFSEQIRFRARWAARPDDLMQALNEDAPSVLHFSGHGAGDQGLCFQSDDGSALHVSTDSLAHVMRAAGASVELVVLNACFSEVQAQALVAHVPCVVGMSGAIGDDSARIFSGAFYRALASGKSVANAHQQGLAALGLPSPGQTARDVSHSTLSTHQISPRLLTRPDTNADLIYLVGAPVKRRCVLVIKATLPEFDSAVLVRVTDELRRLTGDLSIQITDIEEGSVRLTISLSADAARALTRLRSTGQLATVAGFEVADVIDLAASVPSSPHVSQRRNDDADHDLVVLIDRGEIRAVLEQLMRRHGRAVYRFCRVLLRDEALADDVQQKVFLSAFTNLPRFRKQTSLKLWLFAIARNRVLDAAESRQRSMSQSGNASAAMRIPFSLISDADLSAVVPESFSTLDTEARALLLLYSQQGFTVEELAEICTEEPSAVQSRVQRILPQLRDHVVFQFGRAWKGSG